jgi:hypothetical protein
VLRQREADEFMAAAKVVPGAGRPFVWRESEAWARARFPVEVDAIQQGEAILVSSREEPQHWTFKLTYHGDEVYRLDVRPLGNHPNPWNRPAGFPKSVRERVHEHVYVEGLGVDCARPCTDQTVTTHRPMFDTFCDLARVAFEPPYAAPPLVHPRLGPT